VSPFGNNPARQKSGGIASNRLRVWPLTQVSSFRGSDVNLVCRGVCWSGTMQRSIVLDDVDRDSIMIVEGRDLLGAGRLAH
jgi:hypothetical protein